MNKKWIILILIVVIGILAVNAVSANDKSYNQNTIVSEAIEDAGSEYPIEYNKDVGDVIKAYRLSDGDIQCEIEVTKEPIVIKNNEFPIINKKALKTETKKIKNNIHPTREKHQIVINEKSIKQDSRNNGYGSEFKLSDNTVYLAKFKTTYKKSQSKIISKNKYKNNEWYIKSKYIVKSGFDKNTVILYKKYNKFTGYKKINKDFCINFFWSDYDLQFNKGMNARFYTKGYEMV